MDKYELEYLDPKDLIDYELNSKKHPEEQIKRLAKEFTSVGFLVPIVIDSQGVIVSGHGRKLGAIWAGLEKVPVHRLSADTAPERVRAIRLFDNKVAETDSDQALLKRELASLLDIGGFDAGWTGFSDSELLGLLPKEHTWVQGHERAKVEGKTDDDAVPEFVEQNPRGVVRGQVYRLGNHRLMCGDSTDMNDVDKLLEGKRADFCFTSPPYSDQREYNGGKDLSTQKLARFLQAPCDLFAVNLGMQRKNGEVYPYWEDYIAEAKASGLKFLSWNVWDREDAGSIGNQTAMFAITHEWIFVFGSERRDLNLTVPNKRAGGTTTVTNRQADGSIKEAPRSTIREFSQMKTVWRIPAEKARNHAFDHPAMFPVVLPEAHIKACTQPGERVFEPFGGSGTTMIACEKTGRAGFLMEIDPHYCSVILARWEAFTGLKAELSQ